ncbi:MAG: DUF4296 domain-containing protein [Muribaculaceae bacterium]|nr:DUF4296 domain-containing protein [Muribaculaceae bacterium]
MMSNKLSGLSLILFSLFLLLSCSDRPRNVLPEKKMVNLLVDMELAEAYATTQLSPSSKEKVELGKKVLELHGVSEETLDTTLAWYGRNMDEYSELFDKVDKEIQKRRELYTEDLHQPVKGMINIWPYPSHLILSDLSGYDNISFSIPSPDIKKGDILKLSFFMPNAAGLKSTFGVEYSDGNGEATVLNLSGKKNLEMELQSDSGKTVSRIFGTIHIKEKQALPLFIDSISIKSEPFDSLTYRNKRRTQKGYGTVL